MRRSVDGDYFPTLRKVGPVLTRLGKGFVRQARPVARSIGKALVVLIVVLAVVHGIATFITGRKLKADLTALRVKGELPTITELAGPTPPSAENAALVYAEAFKLLPPPSVIDSPDYEQLSLFANAERNHALPRDWDKGRALARKYGKALEIAERAASMEKCRFPVKWEDGFAATFEHYAHLKELAMLANASALVAAKDGRMDEAARYMALSLRIADSIRSEPVLIGVLVRREVIRMTCSNLREVLRHGSFDDQQARRLSRLFAEADLRPHYRKSMYGERATGLIAFRQIRETPAAFTEATDIPIPLPRLSVFIARPLLYSDERFYVRYMGEIIADAGVPFTISNGCDMEDGLRDLPVWRAPITRILMPVFSRAKATVYESIAETRMSQIALRLSAYERRNGKYPDSLARLKIADAETITDPFSDKGLIYRRQGNGFILYSIGRDMKDDGGRKAPIDRDDDRGDIVWRMGGEDDCHAIAALRMQPSGSRSSQ